MRKNSMLMLLVGLFVMVFSMPVFALTQTDWPIRPELLAAAQQGDALAQTNLASYYEHNGNIAEAIKWSKLATSHIHNNSSYMQLGKLYLQLIPGISDRDEKAKLYREITHCFTMAIEHFKKDPTYSWRIDPITHKKITTDISATMIAAAQTRLNELYSQGLGLSTDPDEAAKQQAEAIERLPKYRQQWMQEIAKHRQEEKLAVEANKLAGNKASSSVPAATQPEKQNINKIALDSEPRTDSSIWLFNGHAYQLFPEHIDWHAAKKRCEDMGGYLVCIESEEENSFIYNKVKDVNGTIHLGGTSEEQGTWKWVNGKPFTFTHWEKGQPNNFRGEEHWLVINPGDRLKDRWNDAPSFIPDGGQRSYGFICEWDNPEAAYNATIAPAAAASAAPPSETSAVNAVTSDKPVERKIAGNFMYTPADLTNFENQLDYIEKTFWIAASSNRNDSFYKDIEKKIFILVNSSRVIQATLVAEKKNQNLDLPRRTFKLQDVWRVFAGKGHYYYDTLRCSSRRSYGNYKTDNTASYLQWLQDTMVYNIAQFKNIDNSALNAKISDYFMAIKEVRCAIVDVSELKLFDENPQLGEPDKSTVKGTGTPPPQKKKR